ncbi:MAG: hypothetical protein AAF514_05050 [Verrucomicrobiota bacterium]
MTARTDRTRRRPAFLFASILITIVLSAATTLHGHPISMTSAEANVTRTGIELQLQVLAEDLVLFQKLEMAEDDRYARNDLVAAAKDHEAFVLKYLQIRDSQGQLIPGTITRADLTALPAEGVRESSLMETDLTYHLAFPTNAPHGEPFLTFTHDFGRDENLVPAVLDLTVSQEGIWLDKPVALPGGKHHTVAFDWNHPREKPPEGWAALKKQKEADYQRRLGITSYTGLHSFIYLNDHELRHEILVPVLTFEEWVRIPRENGDFIEIEEQQAARPLIESFLANRNPVRLDGRPVQPKLVRLQFFGLDINDFARNAEPRRVSTYQARIGIILSYPTPQPPTRANLVWESFSPGASFLKSRIFIHEDPPTRAFLTKDQPEWSGSRNAPPSAQTTDPLPPVNRKNRFPTPLFFLPLMVWLSTAVARKAHLQIMTAGGIFALLAIAWLPHQGKAEDTIRPADQIRITESLVRRIYESFEQPTEESIYDALSQNVGGNLLEPLYLEFRQGLEIKEQGGAMARIRSLQFEKRKAHGSSFDKEGFPVLTTTCQWTAEGTIDHWGHRHRRINRYKADFTIAGTDGGWRVIGNEIRLAERSDVETSVRIQ